MKRLDDQEKVIFTIWCILVFLLSLEKPRNFDLFTFSLGKTLTVSFCFTFKTFSISFFPMFHAQGLFGKKKTFLRKYWSFF